jgi:hypothetical protein
MGGGGFLKRGWNDTTEPLRKAKKTNAALPADMMNKAGVRATTPAENAQAWKEHGQALGVYDTKDPMYDTLFANQIEQELVSIQQQEKQLATTNMAAVLRSFSRAPNPGAGGDQELSSCRRG